MRRGGAAVVLLLVGSCLAVAVGRGAVHATGANALVTANYQDLRVRAIATGVERTVDTTTGVSGALRVLSPRSFGTQTLSDDASVVVFQTANIGDNDRALWAVGASGAPRNLTAGLASAGSYHVGEEPSISADNRYVVFRWSDFVPGCTTWSSMCSSAIVRYDLATDTRQVVSLTDAGNETLGWDQGPSVSVIRG